MLNRSILLKYVCGNCMVGQHVISRHVREGNDETTRRRDDGKLPTCRPPAIAVTQVVELFQRRLAPVVFLSHLLSSSPRFVLSQLQL
jgi:hypothetical protein